MRKHDLGQTIHRITNYIITFLASAILYFGKDVYQTVKNTDRSVVRIDEAVGNIIKTEDRHEEQLKELFSQRNKP